MRGLSAVVEVQRQYAVAFAGKFDHADPLFVVVERFPQRLEFGVLTQPVLFEAQGQHGTVVIQARPDGRHVLFSSFASNLVDDDRNGERDAFVRGDRVITR